MEENHHQATSWLLLRFFKIYRFLKVNSVGYVVYTVILPVHYEYQTFFIPKKTLENLTKQQCFKMKYKFFYLSITHSLGYDKKKPFFSKFKSKRQKNEKKMRKWYTLIWSQSVFLVWWNSSCLFKKNQVY